MNNFYARGVLYLVVSFVVLLQYSFIDAKKMKVQSILCVDINNSGVNFGVFAVKKHKPTLLHVVQVDNKDIVNFADTVSYVLAEIKINHEIEIQHACFAAPGVPSAEQDYLAHWRLPYVIDAKDIIKKTRLTTAIIVNDFFAMSYGIDFLDPKHIKPLCDVPAQLHANRAIIGAGNGLGSVTMVWNEAQERYRSLPAEAGTGDFPALSQYEFDLAQSMKQLRNMDTVHWAFFVALPGICYTYKILESMNKYSQHICFDELDGMTILSHAHEDELCRVTADFFFKFYARFVYNFIWTTLPFGGVYFIGSTATEHPEMLSEIFLPEFFNCVASKRDLLKRIPLYIVQTDNDFRLLGIAHYFLSEKISL